MKVYAVSRGIDYEGHDATAGVFSTLEKAEAFAATLGGDWQSIIEFELDDPESFKEVG